MQDRALRRRKLNSADRERGDGREGVNLDYRGGVEARASRKQVSRLLAPSSTVSVDKKLNKNKDGT